MATKMYRRFGLVLGVALAVLLAGCASPSPSPAGPTGSDTEGGAWVVSKRIYSYQLGDGTEGGKTTYVYTLNENGSTDKVDAYYDDSDSVMETTDYTTDEYGNVLGFTFGYAGQDDGSAAPVDGGSALANGVQYKYTLDDDGRPLTMEDGMGSTTTYEYQADGLLAKTVTTGGYYQDENGDPIPITTTVLYDENGYVTSISDTIENKELIGQVPLDLGTNKVTWEFDGKGNPISATTGFENDEYAETRSSDVQRSITFEYDENGNRTKAVVNTRTTYADVDPADATVETVTTYTWEYDGNGNVVKETSENEGYGTRVVEYEYTWVPNCCIAELDIANDPMARLQEVIQAS